MSIFNLLPRPDLDRIAVDKGILAEWGHILPVKCGEPDMLHKL